MESPSWLRILPVPELQPWCGRAGSHHGDPCCRQHLLDHGEQLRARCRRRLLRQRHHRHVSRVRTQQRPHHHGWAVHRERSERWCIRHRCRVHSPRGAAQPQLQRERPLDLDGVLRLWVSEWLRSAVDGVDRHQLLDEREEVQPRPADHGQIIQRDSWQSRLQTPEILYRGRFDLPPSCLGVHPVERDLLVLAVQSGSTFSPQWLD